MNFWRRKRTKLDKMSSLIGQLYNVGADLTGKISDLAIDLTGTRTTNVLDPCSKDCVIYRPHVPLCSSIPGGALQEGTLIALIATPNSSFSKRFNIDFIVQKCEHSDRVITRDSSRQQLRQQRSSQQYGSCHDSLVENNDNNRVEDGDHHHHRHHQGQQRPASSVSSPVSPTSPPPIFEQNEIAFHFNPRFSGFSDSEVVVMNSKIAAEWGDEIRVDQGFPFTVGTAFKLMILVEKDCFKVAIDGRHCYEFKHRCPYQDIGRIHIGGNITVDLLEFRRELQYLTRSPSSCSSVSSASSSSSSSSGSSTAAEAKNGADIISAIAVNNNNHQPKIKIDSRSITSPPLPFHDSDFRLAKPCNIYIAGLMPSCFRRYFVINLVDSSTESRTIPFHMSVRPDQKSIVRNSFRDGRYEDEELYLVGPFPFSLGTHFDLMLSNRPDKISVAVNGQLAFEYEHRYDEATIDSIEITGSALITSIRYEFF